jgi:CRISPR/Cas system-associated endonuclease Cas1
MASHQQVVFTQSAVTSLAKAGNVLVCCDERHHPAAMLLPFEANVEQAERFRKQA